ncbi:hypothetical protein JCM19052_1292 [Vibrio sp. JCM 19052]|nr:hypothetical protein JCM19052_1292 [Vibrio sp. JCM 19052]
MGNSPVFKRALFAVFSVMLLAITLHIWNHFPAYWMQLIRLQRDTVNSLSEYLMLISQGQLLYGWYLLGFSFLYGLLHSVAPGHGKTAVTSMSLIHATVVDKHLYWSRLLPHYKPRARAFFS